MIGISIQVLWQDDEANGEICTNCGKEIKGTKWVMMLQVGTPEDAKPLEAVYCTICKIKWDSEK